MNRALVFVAILAVALAAFASPAMAKGTMGLRGGFSLDPDDFLIGLHFKSDPLGEDLYLVPSVEAGFGDITWIGGNVDLHYVFNTSSEKKPYIGGGGTLNWFDSDGGDDDLEFGGSVLGGLKLNQKLFLEAKIGLGDVPDWKFVVGMNMR